MAFQCVNKLALWVVQPVKFKLFFGRFYTVYFETSRIMYEPKPRTVYFRIEESSEICSLNVLVEDNSFKLKRHFTVVRPASSPISQLLGRLDLKIASKLTKKMAKLKDSEVLTPEVKSMLMCENESLSESLPCRDLVKLKGKLELIIMNSAYEVMCNVPWVTKLNLPKSILSNTTIGPLNLGLLFSDREKASFKWFRSTQDNPRKVLNSKDWISVGEGCFYNVKEDDVGHYLKLMCVPRNDEKTGPEFSEISCEPVVKHDFKFYYLKTHSLTNESLGGNEIRVVTYNILADHYFRTKEGKIMYHYTPEFIMNPSLRASAILYELLGYNADIICLQEVLEPNFQDYLLPQLKQMGIKGIYLKKGCDEGNACFYNTKKFLFLGLKNYVLGQELIRNPFLTNIDNLIQNYAVYDKLTNLPHTLQLLALEVADRNEHILVVGNVHLYASPSADLIRILQAIIILQLYQSFKKELNKMVSTIILQFSLMTILKKRFFFHKFPRKKISLVLCGDFNSTPDCSVYELLTVGHISENHPVWEIGKYMCLFIYANELTIEPDCDSKHDYVNNGDVCL